MSKHPERAAKKAPKAEPARDIAQATSAGGGKSSLCTTA